MRGGGDVLTLLLFFVLVGAVVPFAIGPDKAQLSRLAPGVVWIAAFLSLLLGLDRLFGNDAEDGTLTVFRQAALPLPALVAAQVIAHWLLSALPLLVASPVLAVLLNMDVPTFWRTVLALAIGTPGLAALGAMGAAVTVSLPRGGLLAPVLITPLALPILIFGAGSMDSMAGDRALMLLAAVSLILVAFAPFMAALALTVSED
jgi:heme exporter protein B